MWRRGKNEEQRIGGVCNELDLTEGWNQGVAEAPDYSIGEALMKRPWKSSDEPGRPGAVPAETATWRLGLLRIQAQYFIGAAKATADEE